MDQNIYEEIAQEKDICEKDILNLLDKVKSYHVNNIDISKHYDLNTEFEKFKVDDSLQRYKLNTEITDYKIDLLQSFLNELYEEKSFLDFKLTKEQNLTDQEYKEYITNVVARTDFISRWYSEFMNK